MRSVPLDLAARVLRLTLVTLAAVGPAVALVGRAEGASPDSWIAALWLAGPLVLAGAVAAAATSLRRDGTLDAWAALGRPPAALLMPLLALSLLFGAASMWRSPAANGPFALPAPVDPAASVWWTSERWDVAPGSAYRVSPSALPLPALLHRGRAGAPAGARQGVDRAELFRRVGAATAWVLALALGACLGLRGPRRAAASSSGAVAGAVAATGAWLLLGALLAAYSTT